MTHLRDVNAYVQRRDPNSQVDLARTERPRAILRPSCSSSSWISSTQVTLGYLFPQDLAGLGLLDQSHRRQPVFARHTQSLTMQPLRCSFSKMLIRYSACQVMCRIRFFGLWCSSMNLMCGWHMMLWSISICCVSLIVIGPEQAIRHMLDSSSSFIQMVYRSVQGDSERSL